MGQQSDGANRYIEDSVHNWRLAGVHWHRLVFALILALLSLA